MVTINLCHKLNRNDRGIVIETGDVRVWLYLYVCNAWYSLRYVWPNKVHEEKCLNVPCETWLKDDSFFKWWARISKYGRLSKFSFSTIIVLFSFFSIDDCLCIFGYIFPISHCEIEEWRCGKIISVKKTVVFISG